MVDVVETAEVLRRAVSEKVQSSVVVQRLKVADRVKGQESKTPEAPPRRVRDRRRLEAAAWRAQTARPRSSCSTAAQTGVAVPGRRHCATCSRKARSARRSEQAAVVGVFDPEGPLAARDRFPLRAIADHSQPTEDDRREYVRVGGALVRRALVAARHVAAALADAHHPAHRHAPLDDRLLRALSEVVRSAVIRSVVHVIGTATASDRRHAAPLSLRSCAATAQ